MECMGFILNKHVLWIAKASIGIKLINIKLRDCYIIICFLKWYINKILFLKIEIFMRHVYEGYTVSWIQKWKGFFDHLRTHTEHLPTTPLIKCIFSWNCVAVSHIILRKDVADLETHRGMLYEHSSHISKHISTYRFWVLQGLSITKVSQAPFIWCFVPFLWLLFTLVHTHIYW